MRKVSRIFILMLVLTLVAGCFVAFTACVDDNPDDEPNDGDVIDSTSNYVFLVKDENGEGIQGVRVQLCVPGEGGRCYIPVKTDENGYAVFDGDTVANQVLDIHILLGDNGRVLVDGVESQYTFDNDSLQTTDSYGMIEINLQLAE